MTIKIERACDWCEEHIVVQEIGCIVLTEIPPISEGIDLERYQFCTYKCLTRWLDL